MANSSRFRRRAAGAFAGRYRSQQLPFSSSWGLACAWLALSCAFAAFVAALAAEERVPAGFWVWYFVVTTLSAPLWLVTLPWIQSAREKPSLMFHFHLRTLLILLTIRAPSQAWGRSERHDYRERALLRQQAKRSAPRTTDKPPRLWQGFQLDVF